MVGSFGEVQVMDWGLAKVLTARTASAPSDTDPGETVGETLIRGSDAGDSDDSQTQAGSILGTLAYMPPEQAAGEIGKIDQRSDVFGLGAILAVILTGKPPYAGPDVDLVRVMAIRGDLSECFARLDSCGAEHELVALCRRCLAFQPAERPRDAEALAKEVAGLREATEERARTAEKDRAAAEVKAAEQRKRRRWQAAVAAAVVLILALLGVGAWWKDRQAAERERDRAVAAERDRQEALAAINHAADALAAGDLAATDLALTQAENRLGAGGSSELNTLLAAAKRDRDLIRDLREIEDQSWSPGLASMPEAATMAGRYQAVFARYGLGLGGADLAAVADTVRASRVSAALVAGLSEWFATDPKGPHLRPLLDRLDPDPERVEIRAAIQAGDGERVRALVGSLDGSKAPAWFTVSVGFHPMVPATDAVRLMAASWRTHPAYYPLAYRISRRLWGTGQERVGEMLAWSKVAVALRPDSPFAHSLLGNSWRALRNWGEAEASFRRAIELGKSYPRYVGGHANLGNVLMDKGDVDGAEKSYRTALAIDPDNAAIYVNLGVLFSSQSELVKAEEWFRKGVALAPKNMTFRGGLENVIQRRARLEEVMAGRGNPENAAEGVDWAEFACRPPRRRYLVAVRIYSWAFAADSTLADDLTKGHRYKAACIALRAAAGQDAEKPRVEPAEWSRLTGLALKWLRADLTRMTAQAKVPNRQRRVKEWLEHCKKDSDLVSVRDPASLAAMPAANRKAWEGFWRDVNTLLSSLTPQARLPSIEP